MEMGATYHFEERHELTSYSEQSFTQEMVTHASFCSRSDLQEQELKGVRTAPILFIGHELAQTSKYPT